MVVPPAPDRADALTGTQETDTTHQTRSTGAGPVPGAAWRVPVLLALVLGVLVAGGLLLFLLLGRSGDAAAEQETRDEVMGQGEQFMLRMGTFGPDLVEEGTMPEYRERVQEVITPKFSESFEQQVVVAEQLVTQSELRRDAEVFSTGVSSLDQDSAVALVAGSFTDSYQDEPGRPYPFRIRLDLVKVDGTWLVDDFAPISQDGEAQTGVPGEQPTPPPAGSGGAGGSGDSGDSGGSGGGQ